MNFYSKFIILGVLIIGMAGGMVSTLFSFQKVSQDITAHTNLSAWSLAQLELEYQKFCSELQLYRAGQSSSEKLSLAYDVVWNRMDVFLHGSENEAVRKAFGAEVLVQNVLKSIQAHEALIDLPAKPDSPQLAEWEKQLLLYEPAIRQLMIQNFTGPGVTHGIDNIAVTIKQISWVLSVVSLISLLMSYLLFRESRKHWYLSLHDPLTKLINRAYFQQLLKERCHQARINKYSVNLCLIDITRFHEINNLFGYQSGDELLQQISEKLRKTFSSQTLIARTGGSEFALLLTDDEIYHLLPLTLQQLKTEVKRYDPANRIHLCCGISFFPEQSSSSIELFQFADLALSAAKKNPTHLQYFNSVMLSDFQRRRELATHLNVELTNPDTTSLYLCYQPIHLLDNKDKLGLEVLLRWNHSLFGYIAPPEIIEIAEEHGMGNALGDWIFQRIKSDLSQLPFWLLERLSVAVNLSNSLFNLDLPDRIQQLMAYSPIVYEQLVLELTETIALNDFSVSQQILKSLRQMGIRIALDDFGTGFSSLAYLKDLSVDKLKIDKSFIQQVHLDSRQLSLLKHITELAHDLDLTVVAEGVESSAELEIVTAMGIEEIQGYHYARPLELPSLINYLSRSFKQETSV